MDLQASRSRIFSFLVMMTLGSPHVTSWHGYTFVIINPFHKKPHDGNGFPAEIRFWCVFVVGLNTGFYIESCALLFDACVTSPEWGDDNFIQSKHGLLGELRFLFSNVLWVIFTINRHCCLNIIASGNGLAPNRLKPTPSTLTYVNELS